MDARMYFPFGENLAKDTGGLLSSTIVLRHWPVDVSQIRLSNRSMQENKTNKI